MYSELNSKAVPDIYLTYQRLQSRNGDEKEEYRGVVRSKVHGQA